MHNGEKNFAEWLQGVNWGLLREQKNTLIGLADNRGRVSKGEADHIDGVLNFLSAIQDWAVDKEGLPEREVFGNPED